MNINTSVEPTKNTSIAAQIGGKALLKFAIYILFIPAILFLSAGTLNWGMAWLYVSVIIATGVISWIIMIRTSPDLIAERSKFLKAEGVKVWDKVLAPGLAIFGPLVIWIVAGLDSRFGWLPDIPLVLQFAALVVVVIGYALVIWAVAVNRFFSSVVRIQTDRGHTVITTGPYRFVRHPGYTGGIVSYLATPVALGSLWALIPAGLTVLLLVVRTALEDQMLQSELSGYKEYTQQTRDRLLPGIW
ncbi:MAG: isoprenylcysteine carboxylmethyltransferase family protein [Calothrix sp. MO_192.B10]|nr:isoprenylcysteine carboxylmethyltransferase family protein [Calothrix sp. MO_192.B10]